jgi:purine-cytosine permease-like protein
MQWTSLIRSLPASWGQATSDIVRYFDRLPHFMATPEPSAAHL